MTSGGASAWSTGAQSATPALLPAASEYEHCVQGHACYFSRLLADKGALLKGGGAPDRGYAQRATIPALHAETENLIEAFDTAINRRDTALLQQLSRYLATFFDHFGLSQEALQAFGKLLPESERNGDTGLRAAALLGLAKASIRRGDYAAAQEYCERARDLGRQLPDRRVELASLVDISTTLLNRGLVDQCQQVCSEALPLARELGDRPLLAECLSNFGNVSRAAGDCAAAETYLTETLELRRATGDRRGEAGAINNLSIVKRLQGHSELASRMIEEALAILRAVHDQHSEALVLINAGNTAVNLGQLEDASRHYRGAHTSFSHLGNRHGAMLAASNLACIEMARHDWEAARRILEEALPLIHEVGDKQGLGAALSNLALCLIHLGDLNPGLHRMAEAIEVYRAIGKHHNAGLCCIWAADSLFENEDHATGTVIICGVVAELERRQTRFDVDERRTIDESQARIAAASAGGALCAADLARWKVEGEAMTLDELAEFTLAALREAQAQ